MARIREQAREGATEVNRSRKEEAVEKRRAGVSATIGRMCEGLPLQITIATAKRE